ncbi:winged helix-turn-helix transcriptional regulator [Micromonospora sp. CA-263727]|uniref:winged helix-turn-helix transcriptional regulator n=1 Tax=Micromonospora sp. CA-263727 TaxID=3239967 RepID=UPI003D9111EB
MLTLTLRNLERDGLVDRTVYAQVPPRVEYALTPTGKSLIPPALALASWAIEHVPHIEASRAAYPVPGGAETGTSSRRQATDQV